MHDGVKTNEHGHCNILSLSLIVCVIGKMCFIKTLGKICKELGVFLSFT